jgi:hypothetical protein
MRGNEMTDERTVTGWTRHITEIRAIDGNGEIIKVMLDNSGENLNVPRGVTIMPGKINSNIRPDFANGE